MNFSLPQKYFIIFTYEHNKLHTSNSVCTPKSNQLYKINTESWLLMGNNRTEANRRVALIMLRLIQENKETKFLNPETVDSIEKKYDYKIERKGKHGSR